MTTKASQKDSDCDCALTSSFHPNSVGNSTVCPRLEIGKSSLTPCSRPRTIAWNELRGDARGTASRLIIAARAYWVDRSPGRSTYAAAMAPQETQAEPPLIEIVRQRGRIGCIG